MDLLPFIHAHEIWRDVHSELRCHKLRRALEPSNRPLNCWFGSGAGSSTRYRLQQVFSSSQLSRCTRDPGASGRIKLLTLREQTANNRSTSTSQAAHKQNVSK